MQYHFHLIRNILKLPYCFPSEAHQPPDQITRLMAAKAPLSWGRRLLRRERDTEGLAAPLSHHPLLSS